MKYFVGLDGGGTKTKCVLVDENLEIISESVGGPSNFLIIGTEVVSETIFTLISECAKRAGIEISQIESAVIGTTGAGRKNDAETLKKAVKEYFQKHENPLKNFNVVSDAAIALEGAFAGNAGAILIAGTGSIMYGKDAGGNFHRVGGFGRFLGDEGGGNTLGREGLIAVAKDFDGRGEKTSLTKIVKEKFGINDGATLIRKVYSENFDMATVAPFVIEQAGKGDEICLGILERQSDELILHIKAMLKKLRIEPMPLVLIGSPITKQNKYSEMLKEKINSLGNVTLALPEYPPEIGAAIVALKSTQ